MKDWLSYFYEISQIPRASYKEERIAAYLMQFAAAHRLEAKTDEAHNVLIRKSASRGYEDAPAMLLQGHTDMVCEKTADCDHDFDKEGIHVLRDGDYLRADGTTLGGDDGYAVAAMLAILDDDSLPHPALECLFTTSEEVGMDGMAALDPSWITARRMLNLDSEDEGTATAACAGGVRTYFRRCGEPISARGTALTVTIGGLAGGHSGGEIHRGRGNALKIAARLWAAAGDDAALISMEGGSKDNAIPRECVLRLLAADAAAVRAPIEAMAEVIRAELSDADRDFRVEIAQAPYDGIIFAASDARALRDLIRLMPDGPLGMSAHVPGLVETSSNTAVIRAGSGEIGLTISSRSSVESRLDDLIALTDTLGALCGFTVEHKHRYPGWEFRTDSEVQALYRAATKECLGREGEIIGIHAGLECGLLAKKIPEMDMISIGPDMIGIHTPQERLSVSSAKRTYELIVRMLAMAK